MSQPTGAAGRTPLTATLVTHLGLGPSLTAAIARVPAASFPRQRVIGSNALVCEYVKECVTVQATGRGRVRRSHGPDVGPGSAVREGQDQSRTTHAADWRSVAG